MKKVSTTEGVKPSEQQQKSPSSWAESSRVVSQKELSEKLRRAGENAFIAKPTTGQEASGNNQRASIQDFARKLQTLDSQSRASAGTAGKFEKAAIEEVGRVAEAIFPSRERVVPMSMTRAEISEDAEVSKGSRSGSKPWEQFGISESEYAALRNLEEGGGNHKRRQARKEAAELQSEADAARDEKMWGPDVPKKSSGVSDGEWMANVMQFRNEAENGRQQAMRDQADRDGSVSSQGFRSWSTDDEALLHKMHKEGKLLSEAFRSRSNDAEQASPRSWSEAEKRILNKLSEEGRRVGDMPFQAFRETRNLDQAAGGRGGRGSQRTDSASSSDEPRQGRGSGTAKWVFVSSLITAFAVWNLKPMSSPAAHPDSTPTSRPEPVAPSKALQRPADAAVIDAHQQKTLESREYAEAAFQAQKESERRMLSEVAEQAKKDMAAVIPKSKGGWFWSS